MNKRPSGEQRRFRKGPEDVFARVVEESLDHLYSTALRLSRNPTVAEDLVQDTLLRGLKAWPGLDPSGNLAGYLFRTMVNLFINRQRHAKIVRITMEKAKIGLLEGTAYSSDDLCVWSAPPPDAVCPFEHLDDHAVWFR